MATFPPLTHVALTVRDLSVSVPWYEALFDAEPVLDEDTDPGLPPHRVPGRQRHADRAAPAPDAGARGAVQRVPRRSRPCGLRLRRPGELEKWARGSTSSASTHGDIKDRALRVGRELPRSRRHRAGVLRPGRLIRPVSVAHLPMVTIVDADPEWPAEFERIRSQLRDAARAPRRSGSSTSGRRPCPVCLRKT